MFKRKIYEKLKEWKSESQGKTALLIEGARRIGKSTIVEEFAKNEYKSYILIDFVESSQACRDLFDDVSDLNFLFLQLQLMYGVELHERESLIVFDEVQFCPKARQAIKRLVKDGRYDYIETGSLISIKKHVKDILIPSEERKITMVPMDFEEFLWAIGETATANLLKQAFDMKKPLGNQVHRKMMRTFRLYMLVGGMPQAVLSYLETNNLQRVDAVKRDILSLYEDDFRKIDSTGRLSLLFRSIPAQLAKNVSRYQVSSVLENGRAVNSLELLSELQDSKTVLFAYHTKKPMIGMAAFKDLTKFKMYLADTGLFVTLMFRDQAFTDNTIYEKLLSDKLSVNLGYLFENVVAQMLVAKGDDLYYTTIREDRLFEVDFIIARKNKLCPIEVKSGGYLKHKSLDKFNDKYASRIHQRILISTRDYGKSGDVLLLPVYMTPFI